MPAETAGFPVRGHVSRPPDDVLQSLDFAENLQEKVVNHTVKMMEAFGLSILMVVCALLYLTLGFWLSGWSLRAGVAGTKLPGVLASIVFVVAGVYLYAESRALSARLRYDRVVLRRLVHGLHEIVRPSVQASEFSPIQQELLELRLSRLEFADRRKWFRL